jgi:hypothetical protein
MSYDIYLNDPVTGKTLQADEPHQMKGGSYEMGGTRRMWLNVTYNYGKHFRRTMGADGIRTIYGKTGAESVPILKAAIESLGTDVHDDDYWVPTEGNARRALTQLLAMAQMRPDGVWSGN